MRRSLSTASTASMLDEAPTLVATTPVGNRSRQDLSPAKHALSKTETDTQREKEQEKGGRYPSPAVSSVGTAVGSDAPSSSPYKGSGTTEDPYVVDWLEGETDNPLRFPLWKKSMIVAIAGISTLCVAQASSAYAGGMEPMREFFPVSTTVFTLGITFFVLGFATGPLLWAPLSEIFGRRPVSLFAYYPFSFWCLGCALSQNIETMLVLRFLAGAFGSCPLTNAGGTTADLFSAKTRGLAMSLFAVAPFLGPSLGPVVAGFLSSSSLGWRSTFYFMAIFGICCAFANTVLVPETYAPVLLRKKANKLAKETGHIYISIIDAGKPPQTVKRRFADGIFKPFELLFKEAIVSCIAVYCAFLYGCLYMSFASYTIIFHISRGWSVGVTGLAFLGLAIGTLVGNAGFVFENRRYVRKLKANGGVPLPPEERIPASIIGAFFIPVGLLIFAFTSPPHIHWIYSLIGGALFGAGQLLVFLPLQNYLIDSYQMYAASSLAANAVLRALLGAVFPLFTGSMYSSLGTVWASAIPGFVAILGVPVPWIFWRFGHIIRRNSKYAPGHTTDAKTEKEATEQRDFDLGQELERRESIREEEMAERHTGAGEDDVEKGHHIPESRQHG